MREEDTKAMTLIADAMDKALREFRQAIKNLDRVVDASPVANKGQPMTFEEMRELAEIAVGMRQTVSEGLEPGMFAIAEIIRGNMAEGNDGS